jgi:hypothetical protein
MPWKPATESLAQPCAAAQWRDGSFVVSPDGRRIVFVSQREAAAQIYVMNADGKRPAQADAARPVTSAGTGAHAKGPAPSRQEVAKIIGAIRFE